ncbi:MAG: hypothetical protein AAF632_18695 [Bacteroidota bacterium]
MKTVSLLILLFSVLFSLPAMALDTLYVNKTSTYLVFDEPVEDLDLGGENQDFADKLPDEHVVFTKSFAAKAEGTAVYVKARTDECDATTLYVKAGRQVYVSVLCYRDIVERPLVDLREKTLHKAASYNRENYVPEVSIDLVEERLYELETIKREVFDIAKGKDKLIFSLVNFRADATAIYLRFRMENNSGLVYRMESLSAENVEYYKKGFLSKRKSNRIPVDELIEGNVVDVPAYSHQDYFLALPTYAVGEKGSVLVTIRETSGIRVIQLELPGGLLLKSNLF